MTAKFATVINCMDGRVQDPVNKWMKEKTGAKFIDVITEAGPDHIISSSASASDMMLNRILVSRDKHSSTHLALVAHHDCAGNPVSKDQHLADLRQAADVMASWNLGMQLILLWVNEDWEVELFEELSPA